MNQEIETVLGAIQRWHSAHGETGFINIDTTRCSRLPPPEITWSLLGLIHYRERKRWAWQTLASRIHAYIQRHPDCDVTLQQVLDSRCQGVVPGFPEWAFSLDGNASFVANRVTGEHLHVDVDNGPDVMLPCYFEEYLQKHRRPGPAEQRLGQLYPKGKGLTTALHCLRQAGLFHVIDEEEERIFDFELCRVVDKFVEPVGKFLSAWQDPDNRVLLGSLIADGPVVEGLAKAQGNAALVARAAALSAQSRRRWLNIARVAADGHLPDALYALANAGAEDLSEYLSEALADPDQADVAIEIAGDDARWRPQVYRLFRKSLNHHWHIRSAAAPYLAKHGHPVGELIQGLLKKPADISAAILLALEHAPEQLKPVLSRGLLSRDSQNRLTAAAVLALLDCDWSRQELLAVLSVSGDHRATLECRTALRESNDSEARLAVERWEADHSEQGDRPGRSDEYVYTLEGGCGRALQEKMLELGDRVIPLRTILSGKP